MITTCCWSLVSATSCYLASKRNKQFELIFNDTTLKNKNCEKILGVLIDSKISFDEHSDNISKTANKLVNDLSRVNLNMIQNQKKLLSSFFVTYQFTYCPITWMFFSKISTKKINAIYERSLRILLNDYESSHPFILQKTC